VFEKLSKIVTWSVACIAYVIITWIYSVGCYWTFDKKSQWTSGTSQNKVQFSTLL